MPMEEDDFRFAIDDTRRRHAAIVDLIASSDRQALGLLQLYMTLCGGALSGGAAVVYSSATSLPKFIGYGLFGFAAPIAVGAMFAVAALWPSDINLPGRKPDFWMWAKDEEPSRVYAAYLDQLAPTLDNNTKLNLRLGRLMYAAKLLGAIAPLVAIGSAIAFK